MIPNMSTTPEIINSLRTEFIQEATNAPKLFKDLAKVEHYIAESYKTRSFIEFKRVASFFHRS